MEAYQAVLLSASVAGLIALISLFVTVRTNRSNTQKRETISLIMQFHWDKDYIDARKTFIECRENGGVVTCVTDEEKRVAVNKVLNHYEIMSIGVNSEILSEEIYKLYFRSRLVEDFKKSKGYIEHVRDQTNNEKIFEQYERLARRWASPGELPP